MALTEQETFFYRNAGYSYDPKRETAQQGRERTARDLAHAETMLRRGPYFVTVERSTEAYDGCTPYDGPVWDVRLWSVGDSDTPELIGACGGVACEEFSPYLRVVAAELAHSSIKGE